MDKKYSWHSMDIDSVIQVLKSSKDKGLVFEESKLRLNVYGENRIESIHKKKWYRILLRQFTDILIIILLIAAIISFLIGETADAMTILAIVVLNGILGFVQEFKAEKAIEALQKMLSPKCRVVRDGKKMEIDSVYIVPGDIVLLEIGDVVPADLRLIEAVNLKVDESALTGESVSVAKSSEPVDKDSVLSERKSLVYMGTNITNGYAKGVVIATGMKTEVGKIAKMTSEVEHTQTHLQKKLAVLGKKLGIISVGVSVFVATIGYIFGKPLIEMFLTGVSLAVAVVPEGLPAVVTITLALGVKAMIKQNALLRRLQAAETLGSANVICTDKTGTLTQNQMTLKKIWMFSGEVDATGIGYDPKGHFEQNSKKIDYKSNKDLTELLTTGVICNHATLQKEDNNWTISGEPTEAALIVAAYKAHLPPDDKTIVTEFSFNSQRKMMSVITKENDSYVVYSKGAPEIILKHSSYYIENSEVKPLNNKAKEKFINAYETLAKNGLRTLALAKKTLEGKVDFKESNVEKELILLGVVGIIDPPRPEVLKAIETAKKAGIKVVMITGDSALTAAAIASKINLDYKETISGKELNMLDDDELRKKIGEGAIFARVTPKDKLRIVSLLQKENLITAMTGDGVNDAPALKKADIGIAMGKRGTDVAKGAADMILLDDNFASIINAVKEGRRQFENIKKFVTYLLSSNMGEVVAIFVNILLEGPLILLPVQILWMNLVTDGLTAVALGVEKTEKGIMNKPPRKSNEPFIKRRGAIMILLLGGYIGAGTLWLFHHYLSLGLPKTQAVALAQTVAFTGIIILEKINVFNYRFFDTPIFIGGFFSNTFFLIAWFLTVSLQVAAVYVPFLQKMLHTVPLGLNDWLLIFAVALPLFVLVEIYKIAEWKLKRQ